MLYYLWAFEKAMSYIEQSQVAIAAGNIGPADMGTLAAADAPAFANRGPSRPSHESTCGPVGSRACRLLCRSNEPARWYFDLARTLLDAQNADGNLCARRFTHLECMRGSGLCNLVLARSTEVAVLPTRMAYPTMKITVFKPEPRPTRCRYE